MHVIARTEASFFSLTTIEAIAPPTENDFEWLKCEVQWRQGEHSFQAVSECLTSHEAKELAAWIGSLKANPRDSVLSFNEPSLHCVSLLASDIVIFVCGLELASHRREPTPVTLAFPRLAVKLSD